MRCEKPKNKKMRLRIKRYLNRKLYNTHAKKYITLDEIVELIRDGDDITVVDASSGEDITTVILTQVIIRQEKKGERRLSHSLLEGLIRAHEDTLEVLGLLLHTNRNWSGFLNSAGVPTHDDIELLRTQIDVLTLAVDELARVEK